MVGILKAYTTRVGSGPFPTELFDDMGEYLRKSGARSAYHRPAASLRLVRRGRRPLRSRVNGITDYFLTKLDVLSGLERCRSASPTTSTASGTTRCR